MAAPPEHVMLHLILYIQFNRIDIVAALPCDGGSLYSDGKEKKRRRRETSIPSVME